MYRPPIRSGWADFGAGLAAGVRDGIDRYQTGRRQRVEDDRYTAEMKRRGELDRQANEDRRRAWDLQNAELGVLDPDEAYESVPTVSMAPPSPLGSLLRGAEPVPGAQGPVSRNEPLGVASSVLSGAREAMADAQTHTERRLRPGVVKAGGLLIDPRRGLGFQRQEAAAEAERQREQRERAERLALVEGLTGTLPQNERNRVIAQSVYGVGIPQSREEVLDDLEAELTLRDRFAAREDNRQFSQEQVLRSISAGGGGRNEAASLPHSRTSDSAEGIAASLAYEIVTYEDTFGVPPRDSAGRPTDPLVYVRGRLREWARNEGVDLTEGEIQRIAADQLSRMEDQQRQRVRDRRPSQRSAAGRSGRAPATQGPGPTPGTQRVPNAGRQVTIPIDPQLVQGLAQRIRNGATPQQLRDSGFSEAEIQAGQQAARQ